MGREKGEPFQATNWKQLSAKEIENLSLIETSRYFAYEPSPHISRRSNHVWRNKRNKKKNRNKRIMSTCKRKNA